MSPMEIWCNESAGALRARASPPSRSTAFAALCDRERCPFAVVGVAHGDGQLVLAGSDDADGDDRPVDMPLDVLLGKPPRMTRDVARVAAVARRRSTSPASTLREAALRVLRLPDRRRQDASSSPSATAPSAGSATATRWSGRGRCRSPTCAVTLADHDGFAGEAMAMRRAHAARAVDAPASGRMAIGEALTNLAGRPDRRARRRQAVVQLDGGLRRARRGRRALRHGARRRRWSCARRSASRSRSARTRCRCAPRWSDERRRRRQVDLAGVAGRLRVRLGAPTSRGTLTPQLPPTASRARCSSTSAPGATGSAARASRRCTAQFGDEPPDLDDPQRLRRLFAALAELRARRPAPRLPRPLRRRAVGRRCCEMAFAGGASDVDLRRRRSRRRALFAEELGAVLQVPAGRRDRGAARARARTASATCAARRSARRVRRPTRPRRVGEAVVLDESRPRPAPRVGRGHRGASQRCATTPRCADEEHAARSAPTTTPACIVAPRPSTPTDDVAAPYVSTRRAAAGRHPARAGRQRPGRDGGRVRPRRLRRRRRPHDRPPGRPLRPRRRSAASSPAAASPTATCSAPARAGPSRSSSTRGCAEQFARFFAPRRHLRARHLQRLPDVRAPSRDLIPGAEAWPRFVRNRSEQFEARLALVEILDSPSVLFAGMAGCRIPIAVAHGEGCADFSARAATPAPSTGSRCASSTTTAGPRPSATRTTPTARPAGSPRVTTPDGRFTILMPHPERVSADRADVVASGRGGRGEPVDADVPQRPGVGRLMARLLRADDVETTTFTQTQFREGYDERQVDDLLADVVATLRRYESVLPQAGSGWSRRGWRRCGSPRPGSGAATTTRRSTPSSPTSSTPSSTTRRGVPCRPRTPGRGPRGRRGPAADRSRPPSVERESWRARVVRVLRGEEG